MACGSSVSSNLPKGELPIAPSALAPVETQVLDFTVRMETATWWIAFSKRNDPSRYRSCGSDFAESAKKRSRQGSMAWKSHGGNGYLIDQFLRTNSNKRTDNYGGSRENRLRFLIERSRCQWLMRLVPIRWACVWPRSSPSKDMNCPDIVPTIRRSIKGAASTWYRYLHLSEADWDDAPVIPESFRVELRELFSNTIIVAGSYTPERRRSVSKGYADLVAFGRPFVANPDLVSRLQSLAT